MFILYKSKNLGSLEFEMTYISNSSLVQPKNDAFVFLPGVKSILFPSLIMYIWEFSLPPLSAEYMTSPVVGE